MAARERVRWWIPATGLAACATLLTWGFAETIEDATRDGVLASYGRMDVQGLSSVEVEAHYRDVTLTGPPQLEEVAIAGAQGEILVRGIAYVAVGEPEPHPTPEPSPSLTPSPEPTPTESPELTLLEALPAVLEDASGIPFAFDSAALDSAARRDLRALAVALRTVLADEPTLRIEVSGHTDGEGPDWYNNRLSEIRADEVAAFLVAQGVPADALVTVGRGKAQPIAPNDTEGGRAANRRVDFMIVED